jgi:TonB family protein
MIIAFAFLALILQAGASPTSAPALEYFVIPVHPRIHIHNCLTGQKASGQSITAGAVVLWIEETESLLRVIDVETGQTMCIRAGKKDLIPIRPMRARDGTLASFPGKLYSITMPEAVLRGIPPVPEADLKSIIPQNVGAGDPSGSLPPPQTLLIMVVNKDGHVSRCQILRPSGHSYGDRLAEQTVCSAHFGAATQGGQPVAVTLVLRFVSTP